MPGSHHHQRLPDAQPHGAGRDGLEEVDGLGQGELVHLDLVDRHQLVSREQPAMMFCRATRDQGPDHHHTATSVQRVLGRRHRQMAVIRMDEQGGWRQCVHPLAGSGAVWAGTFRDQKASSERQTHTSNPAKGCSSWQPAEGDKDQS